MQSSTGLSLYLTPWFAKLQMRSYFVCLFATKSGICWRYVANSACIFLEI